MSSTVKRLEPGSRSDAAHGRAAGLVKTQRQLNDRLDAFFREIDEVKELLRVEGSLWSGPTFDPPIDAAYAVWAARGPKETRVDLDRIGPVPMMDVLD